MSGGNGLGRDHRDGQEHEQHTDGLDACHALAQYEDRKVDAGRWLEGGKNGGDIETTAMSSEHEQGIAQGIQDSSEHHQGAECDCTPARLSGPRSSTHRVRAKRISHPR